MERKISGRNEHSALMPLNCCNAASIIPKSNGRHFFFELMRMESAWRQRNHQYTK